MIQKTTKTINFAKGLDNKTDPWQVSFDNFQSLTNQVFLKGGRLTKRNGNERLPDLPSDASYITTFNDNPTAIGNNIYALNESDSDWVNKGSIQPLQLSTLALIRNNLNQIQCDSAVSTTGLVCTVYSESNASVVTYKYAIANVTTGQNIVAPTAIPVSSGTVTGSPRVFVLGNFFVVVFTNVISATSHLQYIAISLLNPTTVTTARDIAAAYDASTTLAWDGVVSGVQLFIGYNTSSGGQSVKVTYLTATAAASGSAPVSPVTFATYKATLMTLCADETNPAPIIWVNFYRSDTSLGYVLAVDQSLNTVLSPTATTTTSGLLNLASTARTGVCTFFYEVSNAYSYDATVPSNFIRVRTITQLGVVSSGATVIRSVGLASKAFLVDGTSYFLAAYKSPYQPTYFLINGTQSGQASPVVSSKLAYENGGGYLTLGLPSVSVLNSNECSVPYLFKDLIAAVNKDTNVASGTQTAGIYSQTGINLCTFTIGTQNINSVEIGKNLLLTGGFLWSYDGYTPNEQNFFLYPDSVEVTAQTDPAPTGTATNTSTILTAISSTTGIGAGMNISGTGLPGGVTVVSVSGTQVTMSLAATGTNSGTYTFTGNLANQQYYVQATYEWSDNQGNIYRSAPSIPVTATTSAGHTSLSIKVPTLRLTYKVANPVKIVTYRWSVAQQIYYQTTSLTSPTLNDTTADSVTVIDPYSDAQILGNNIIYTNGGVLEDMNSPATDVLTIFDNRLWSLDSENRDQWWYSKQVIQGVPVEMSDFLTYFIAPTTSVAGNTGHITSGAPMDDKLVSYKENAIYYTAGTGPDNTGSNNNYGEPIFVTSTVGCSNQKSIVLTPGGLVSQSNKGFWLLDRGLSTKYIGASVENFNTSTCTSAFTIPETNQVRFTLDTGETLMYDYFYEQWGPFEGVPAISAAVSNDRHVLLNSSGQVYREKPGSYVDGSNPVLLSLTTAWLNLAGLQGYQRAFFFYLLGEYLSPFKLLVSVAYDYDTNPKQSSLITPTNVSTTYGGTSAQTTAGTNSQNPYGQQSVYGGEASTFRWRVFLKKQRCEAIQLTIQEVYDANLGVQPGAGLTLSAIDLIYGVKSVFRPMPSRNSIGGGTK
jgi:hypothetical protein